MFAPSDLTGMQPRPAIHDIKPGDLPAPPQSALEMLRACSRDDLDNNQLAEFARTDPVLVAEVLRVVNTPLFGVSGAVSSVRHAISLLGVRALRNIVLCLMVREAVEGHAVPGLDLTLFWEDTLRRAVTARWLGAIIKLDRDDCFTAGLLQDFGLLALLYLYPEHAHEYVRLRTQDPDTRYRSEKALFGVGHDEVIMMLISSWALPTSMAAAIGNHHHGMTETDALGGVLQAADWVNAVYCVAEVKTVFDRARDMLGNAFDIADDDIELRLAELPREVTDTAQSLGLHIQSQPDFEQILRQANSRLARENTDYQELTWKLERAIAERDRLADELNQEIAIAQEVQQHLMPDTSRDALPIYGLNLPARNISGDFFDYQQLRDGRICFALGDVSGKGINAGLLMAKTASLFHCLAKHIQDPAQLLTIINNEICETSVRGFFVTMMAGVYQPGTGELRLVNAGHLPALLLGPGDSMRVYDEGEPPLGILPDTRYCLSEPFDLRGAALYLYTDGVTEAKTRDGGMLEQEGLVTLLREHAGKAPMQRLQAVVDAIRPQQQLHDDITLLMVGSE